MVSSDTSTCCLQPECWLCNSIGTYLAPRWLNTNPVSLYVHAIALHYFSEKKSIKIPTRFIANEPATTPMGQVSFELMDLWALGLLSVWTLWLWDLLVFVNFGTLHIYIYIYIYIYISLSLSLSLGLCDSESWAFIKSWTSELWYSNGLQWAPMREISKNSLGEWWSFVVLFLWEICLNNRSKSSGEFFWSISV